jgi:hypothetical protein
MNYLITFFGTRIKIITILNELESHQLIEFETGFTAIHNILFDSSYSILFVVDTQGTYIKAFALNKSSTEFSEISQLYLGKGNAIITSIVVIDDVFLAVNNSNKSIYIFKYKTDAQPTYFTRFYNILVNSYNTPIMKINYCDFNAEEDFFQKDFKRLGSLLLYNKKNKILTSICHNGIVYKLKIDLDGLRFDLIEQNVLIENKTIYKSIVCQDNDSLDFSFMLIDNKDKKAGNEDRWVII